jgi:thiamine biosynthesis lipoprotein
MTTTTIAPLRRAWVEKVQGRPVTVHLRGADVDGAEAELRVCAFFADLRRADATAAAVLALCDDAHWRTGGWFDARVGHGPDLDAGGPASANVGRRWAAERAVRRLRTFARHGWRVNVDGDVLAATAPGHPPWRVGVLDRVDPTRAPRVVNIANGAVATVGGLHAIDPFTGRPAGRVTAVTVTGPSLLWAHVYATAAAAQGRGALDWLDATDGYEAVIVDRHQASHSTAGWAGAHPSPGSDGH